MIPLHEPRFDENDESMILSTLRSSWVSTGGPCVEEFEREFAKYVGCKHAVSVCNGTVGLHLAIEILKRRRGLNGPFHVLVPTLSFIATANAVVHSGGYPIFVDAAPNSMNSSASEFFQIIHSSFKRDQDGNWSSIASGIPLLAILPAHIMGWGADVSQLRDMAQELNIDILEDAAEALGSKAKSGQALGSFGVASVFSFNGNKILTTGGGGMIVTNDDSFAQRAKHLSTTAKIDAKNYIHDEVGYNYRLVNILGALGLSQLKTLDEKLVRKSDIFARYSTSLPQGRFYTEAETSGNHWLVNIQFTDFQTREKALSKLNQSGVGARPLWSPFHRQPALSSYEQFQSSFPHADRAWETTLSLPSSPHLKDEEIEMICGLLEPFA